MNYKIGTVAATILGITEAIVQDDVAICDPRLSFTRSQGQYFSQGI